jgi:hypothetical protein
MELSIKSLFVNFEHRLDINYIVRIFANVAVVCFSWEVFWRLDLLHWLLDSHRLLHCSLVSMSTKLLRFRGSYIRLVRRFYLSRVIRGVQKVRNWPSWVLLVGYLLMLRQRLRHFVWLSVSVNRCSCRMGLYLVRYCVYLHVERGVSLIVLRMIVSSLYCLVRTVGILNHIKLLVVPRISDIRLACVVETMHELFLILVTGVLAAINCFHSFDVMTELVVHRSSLIILIVCAFLRPFEISMWFSVLSSRRTNLKEFRVVSVAPLNLLLFLELSIFGNKHF